MCIVLNLKGTVGKRSVKSNEMWLLYILHEKLHNMTNLDRQIANKDFILKTGQFLFSLIAWSILASISNWNSTANNRFSLSTSVLLWVYTMFWLVVASIERRQGNTIPKRIVNIGNLFITSVFAILLLVCACLMAIDACSGNVCDSKLQASAAFQFIAAFCASLDVIIVTIEVLIRG